MTRITGTFEGEIDLSGFQNLELVEENNNLVLQNQALQLELNSANDVVSDLQTTIDQLQQNQYSKDESIISIKLPFGDGSFAFGSAWWYENVLITAQHVPADNTIANQELLRIARLKNPNARIYQLNRPVGTENLYLDGGIVDALLVGAEEDVIALKDSCPSPQTVALKLGMVDGAFSTSYTDPIMKSEGYPYGTDHNALNGYPETRYGSKYGRWGQVDGIYGFSSSVYPDKPDDRGEAASGTSGGRATCLSDGNPFGIVVRAGYSTDISDETLWVQPLTNTMTWVEILS